MEIPHKNYLIRSTLQKIQKEYEVIRQKIQQKSDDIKQSVESGGGTHDNAMYDAELREQEKLIRREAQLREYIKNPVVIEDLPPEPKIDVGKRVSVKIIDQNKILTYVIVGPLDIEYQSIENSISYLSPIAQQILGKGIGDKVKIKTPSTEYEVEIMKISSL